jgi:hypothetical protein
VCQTMWPDWEQESPLLPSVPASTIVRPDARVGARHAVRLRAERRCIDAAWGDSCVRPDSVKHEHGCAVDCCVVQYLTVERGPTKRMMAMPNCED